MFVQRARRLRHSGVCASTLALYTLAAQNMRLFTLPALAVACMLVVISMTRQAAACSQAACAPGWACPTVQSTCQRDFVAVLAGITPGEVAVPAGGIGYPGGMQLSNGALPILLSANGQLHVYGAAARLATRGRVVGFAKEAFVDGCAGSEWCGSALGRLLVNSISWASGKQLLRMASDLEDGVLSNLAAAAVGARGVWRPAAVLCAGLCRKGGAVHGGAV